MIEWMKSIADLTDDASTEVRITELRYTGVIGGSDYFISSDDFKLTHPLYEYMQGNEYLKAISTAKPVLVHTTKIGVAHVSELKRTKIVELSSLVEHNQQLGAAFGIQDGSSIAWRDSDENRNFSPTWNDAGMAFDFWGLHERDDSPLWTSIIPGGQPDCDVTTPETSARVVCGYPVSKDANDWFDELKYSLNFVGALGSDKATHLGCVMHYLYRYDFPGADSTVSGTFQLDLPCLAGYRRWATVIPTPNGLLFCGGYLFGEGDDFFWSHFGMSYACGYANNHYGADYPLKIRSVKSSEVYESDKIKRLSGDTFSMMWPLSWNSEFVSSMNLGPLSSTSEEPVIGEKKSYIYTLMTAGVTRIDGQLTYDSFARYLTGLGVYTPTTADKLDAISKSWDKLPSGVAFAIVSEKCSGRSVKETASYKEYGRKRAKACKDNDFLDKPYNANYTWKQVDNMLNGLTTRSVWVIDASNAEVTTTPNVSVPEVEKTVTFTKKTDNSVSYVFGDGSGAGNLVLSADNFTSFAEANMPFRIIDNSLLLDPILKEIGWADVAAFNKEGEAQMYSGLSLNMGTRAMGKADRKSVV